MSDNLTIFGVDYTNVTDIKAKGTGNGTLTYVQLTGTKSITANDAGTVICVPQGCLETYQTAMNWSTYANYIQEEEN